MLSGTVEHSLLVVLIAHSLVILGFIWKPTKKIKTNKQAKNVTYHKDTNTVIDWFSSSNNTKLMSVKQC